MMDQCLGGEGGWLGKRDGGEGGSKDVFWVCLRVMFLHLISLQGYNLEVLEVAIC